MTLASDAAQLECRYAYRWHQRCQCRERRLRCVATFFWAALGQAVACLKVFMWELDEMRNRGCEISVKHLLAVRLYAHKVCRTECRVGTSGAPVALVCRLR